MKSQPLFRFVCGLAVVLPLAAHAAPSNIDVRRSPVVRIVQKVRPAVVNISALSIVQAPRRSLFDQLFSGMWGGGEQVQETQALGSGVIIKPSGYVLTNEHVVEGASQIHVTLVDGRELDATLVGSDIENDLALLRLKLPKGTTHLPFLKLVPRHDLMVGETLIAIGNPFGLQSTVTVGVVSALNRTVTSPRSGRTYTDFIQTDASINPGNSGGALVDITGSLAGINTAIIASAQGIGFAIPAARAYRVVEDLLHFGHVRPLWLGAILRSVATRESRAGLLDSGSRGILVRRVFPGSPAAKAGLHRGDLIVAINGRRASSPAQVRTAMASMAPGGVIHLTVLGSRGKVKLNVAPVMPPRDIGQQILRRYLGLVVGNGAQWVVVRRVIPGSPAAATGIEPGDLVLAVHGQRIGSVSDLDKVLRQAPDASSVLLVIGRGQYAYNLTFPLDE
ncbi:MAG: PDZ domain-containing protein [Acidobacteria bacterium]|nr:PDZ domain-containing protein [Acidobacteriota bacterium]